MSTIVGNLGRMLVHPRRTSRTLLARESVSPSLTFVVSFAVVFAILSFISYLTKSYPGPPEVVAAYGEYDFGYLPFLKIPADEYRLWQALFMVPLFLVIWVLMAGFAGLISILSGGKGTFKQYLTVFGFSFFSPLLIAFVTNSVFTIPALAQFDQRAAEGGYGGFIQTIMFYFHPIYWTVLPILGGLYNGIAAREIEHFSIPKCVLIAFLTAIWPILLLATLLR